MVKDKFDLTTNVMFAIAFLASGLVAAPAISETNAPSEAFTEEIVVTAQRRQENMQDVPISITALGKDELDRYFLEQSAQLADVIPNLYIPESGGENTYLNVTIRGVNNPSMGYGSPTSAAVYSDEMVLESWLLHSQAMYDLERVEVLRGPQGTLFGRNSTSGAVQFISARPGDDWEGYARVLYGTYDRIRVEGAYGGPVSDSVGVRVAGFCDMKDGYVTNINNGDELLDSDVCSVRGIVEFNPSDDLEIFFKAQAGTIDHEPDLLPSTAPPPNPWELASFVPDPSLIYNPGPESDYERINLGWSEDEIEETIDDYQFNLTVNWDLGNVLLTSVTGYANIDFDYAMDQDANALVLFAESTGSEYDTVSQELRLTSQTDSPLQWIAGLYYLDTHWDSYGAGEFTDLFCVGYPSEDCLFFPGFPANTGFGSFYFDDSYLTSYAAFVHTTYAWTDKLTTTHAIRYTKDDLDRDRIGSDFTMFPRFGNLSHQDASQHIDLGAAYDLDQSESFGEATWRLAVDYAATDDLLYYASISHGYKAGSFGNAASTAAGFEATEPEMVNSYEVGVKSQWLDNRLKLNGAVFYYDYENYLTSERIPTTAGIATVQTNIPEAEFVGGELEMVALLTDKLMLNLALGVSNNEITKYIPGAQTPAGDPIDYAGNTIPRSPELDFHGSIRYFLPFMGNATITPQFDWNFRGDRYSDKENTHKAGEYWIYNASLNYARDDGKGLSIDLFVRNLTDERAVIIVYIPDTSDYGTDIGIISRPRTWGVRMNWSF